ncbi:MAG: hypothetical protein JJU02_14135 [Cryomorphaceae bacterium]|nr:hypothetical protein [Cryomorphaceae bacterium]
MLTKKFLLFVLLISSVNVFSQERVIVKDFTNNGIEDTLKLDFIRLPKYIPTYIEFIDGNSLESFHIEALMAYNRFNLGDCFAIYDELNDVDVIKAVFSEVYFEEIPAFDTIFSSCQTPSHMLESIDISDLNKHIKYINKNVCFKYDTVLPLVEKQYILSDKLNDLWENGWHCLGDFYAHGKEKEIFEELESENMKIFWHFWGDKIRSENFKEFKINDSISYFEHFGCVFLKVNKLYSWLILNPKPSFWSLNRNEVMVDDRELTIQLYKNYLFVETHGFYGSYIRIINLKGGLFTSLDIKDFKDFRFTSNNELECFKHYGDPEIYPLEELIEGW